MNWREALAAGVKHESEPRGKTESYVSCTTVVEPWRWRNHLGYRYRGPGNINGVAPDPNLTVAHSVALRKRRQRQFGKPAEPSEAVEPVQAGLFG